MSEISLNPDKKKRKSAPKSSAGCITCKVRHVRCDEQKPACSRCIKSGRQCDGYSLDGRRPNQAPLQIVHWQPDTLALYRISVDIAGNNEERRAFQFFREHSTADFPGFFESSFWSRLVLQASHAEPSIRHAVIALGSLHEHVRQEEWTSLKNGRTCDPFALQQCNKAIGHLNQIICSNGQRSKEMLLMSCAIFVCFESLQGNYESALSHMLGGLRIFRDWQAEAGKISPARTASSPQHQQSIDSEIVQMFSRLNVQMLVFPDTHLIPADFVKQAVHQVIDPFPGTFTTLKEARDCLDNCMSYQLQASAAAYFNGQSSENNVGPGRPQHAANEDLLPQWSASFDAFVEKAGPSLRPEELQGVELLQIQYNCAKILLSIDFPPRETAFDEFAALFENVVCLATSVIHKSGLAENSERQGNFSFETAIVPPLYFTATRCRDSWIRRQALSLLASTSRQEGLWNSGMLSRIAERLILIEEERDDIGHVTRSEGILVTSRLSVLNATIYSAKRQVLVECCQHKCSLDGEMTLLDEWIMY